MIYGMKRMSGRSRRKQKQVQTKKEKEMKRIQEHLYEHQHVTKDGPVTTRYYAKFTTWDRRPLTVALGDDLNAARVKLDRLHKLNAARSVVELDEEKELREALQRQAEEKEHRRKSITFAEWTDRYQNEIVPPDKRGSTLYVEASRIKALNDFFGDTPLREIDLALIQKYINSRKGKVAPSTLTLSVSTLRYLLNLAADHGILDAVPRLKLKSESTIQRSVHVEEYEKIIAQMPREQQRVVIAWWETAMRHREAFNLRWPMVDFRAGLLRLPADILKEKSPRRTPISYELHAVLEELRNEQSKIANLTGHVFTRKNGQPIDDISKTFKRALHQAGLDKITPHSFRRACITRWTDLGIPRDVVMTISGHKPSGVHDGYINLTDQMLVNHFRDKGLLMPPSERKQQVA
jgi:integrase